MKLTSEDIIKLLLRVVTLKDDNDVGYYLIQDKYLKQDIWDMIEDLKKLPFIIENIEGC